MSSAGESGSTSTNTSISQASSASPASGVSGSATDDHHKSVATGTIVGATIGGIAALGLLAAIVIVSLRRYHHKQSRRAEITARPFMFNAAHTVSSAVASPKSEGGVSSDRETAKETEITSPTTTLPTLPIHESAEIILRLQERLEEMQNHLESLRSSQASDSEARHSALEAEVAALRRQITHLDQQQQSLTDELFPPPEY